MDTSSIKGYLDDIKKAKDNNTLAIFVGSGITMTSAKEGVKVPLWKDLIESLKEELDDKSETDYLKIAELYYLKHGNKRYSYKVKESIPENLEPSNTHKKILSLNPQVIITTNWDDLMEKAIDRNGYFYDKITCDDNLGNSLLPKKLIKMHGDFTRNNFVFKESDYVNYKDNFPLIENYIKSILSSSTVLFLGYSFSDFNLKQILGWINHRTKFMPSLYIALNEISDSKRKYLENHKLIPIEIKNNELDDFLEKIKNDFTYNNVYPEDYILSKIKHLNSFNYIFFRDIESAIKNCRVRHYEKEGNILFFEKANYRNNAYEEYEKEIFDKFIDRLNEASDEYKSVYSNTFREIFKILGKAEINGIGVKENKYIKIPKDFESENKWLTKCLNFDFIDSKLVSVEQFHSLEQSIIEYNIGKYESAINLLRANIETFLLKKDYFWSFVSMLSSNNLRPLFQFWMNINNKNIEVKHYNLEERILNLSYDLRKSIESIYSLNDFSKYYKEATYAIGIFLERESYVKSIEKGGSAILTNPNTYKATHKAIINFIICNFLIVEDFSEFILIIELFLRTTVLRSIESKIIKFNNYEIFSTFKYLDKKKISLLLEPCFLEPDTNDYRKFELESDKDKAWLINVFSNLSKLYLSISLFEEKQKIVKYLENLFFLMPLIGFNDENINSIHKIISKLLREINVTLSIIEGIMWFMFNQNKIHPSHKYPKEKMLETITIFLNKFSNNNISLQEYHAIEGGYFGPIFQPLAKQKKVAFKDLKLIKRVLENFNTMKNSDLDEKSRFVLNFLFPLYFISNKNNKKEIQKYINSYSASNPYYKIQLEINSIIFFKLSKNKSSKEEKVDIKPYIEPIENLISETKELIEKEKSSLAFNVMYAFISLKDFIEKENIKENNLLTEIKNLILKIENLKEKMKFPIQI